MKSKRRNKRSKWIFLLVGLFLLAVIAVTVLISPTLFLRQNSQTTNSESNTYVSTQDTKLIFSNDDPELITKSVYDYFKNKFETTQLTKGSLWWISDDGWNILDNNAVKTDIYFKLSSGATCQAYNAPQVQPCSKIPQIMETNKILSDVFISNGFIKNELNSSKSLDDVNFYDYIIAFQKNNTKCLLVTNGDGGTGDHTGDAGLTVKCSNNFQKAYQDQLPYLKALAQNNNNLKNAVINEETIRKYGDMITLDYGFRRTGLEAVMIKAGDAYKVLFTFGQQFNQNQCYVLRQNGASQELLKDCN